MALSAGTRLGPYEILSPLGAGGMGEVYRARDTRLDRTVALKTLPTAFAAASEARERFKREARVVSALNHPHICVLHDIGCDDGIDYLVMEYLDGECLQRRLLGGPLPIQECLTVALQIAAALDEAHHAGVIHRDLKPGNVMLTGRGAKLLDFGLALVLQSGPSVVSGASVSTVTQSLTAEGTLVGTLQYMSPEQLQGKKADVRTDIFAFGAIVYEMLTGRRAFTGSSPATIIAAILTSKPPVNVTQPSSPPALEHILAKCLEKDPARRWQCVRDLIWQLEWIQEGGDRIPERVPQQPVSGGRRATWAWLVAAIGIFAGAIGIFLRPKTAEPKHTLSMLPPSDYTFRDFAVSPDSTRIAFTAVGANGRPQLWIRRMDASEPHAVPGTDGAALPFWSPDTRSIAFFAERQLKRMVIDGDSRPAQTLADAPDARGGTWNRHGVILFAPNIEDGLYRVPANGGAVVRVTTPNLNNHENSHRWPQFLPDGHTFIYLTRSSQPEKQGIYAARLDSPQPKLLLETAYAASYAGSRTGSEGHMLFLEGDVLFSQPFDPRQLRFSGERSALAQAIGTNSNRPYYAAQDDSMIIYRVGEAEQTEIVWRHRSGAVDGPHLPINFSTSLRISPDQRYVAVSDVDVKSGSGDIWVIDLERGTRRRLTSHPAYDWIPIWSPDGTRIAFASNRSGPMDLYETAASGAESEKVLLRSPERKTPTDWTKDGRFLIYQQEGRNTKWDLWALPLGIQEKPVTVLQSEFDEVQGSVSPDGKWLAYSSNETGKFEVYVQHFLPGIAQNTNTKVRLSLAGGVQPQWRLDGRELFYLSSDSKIQAVNVETTGTSFKAGDPKPLFDTGLRSAESGISQRQYAPSKDGSRILTLVLDKKRSSSPITVVLNWSARTKP